ncbi:sigma intracellular receptor 2-like [Paramacrobiotus metropolitanus]|uniref:sigma intracellular receptor 2-like n=1 Tax=Paramacrobiotus metropolitanus TaxID=2943436 RepID=UPI0024457D03|nr:sigma intracellular receptor 2-like [Paramacrobiotus metropolitanus]XP_055328227.1 sigma intracellular receptor 2-like [Paramacrobiotus metropolitanus]
MAIFQRIRDFIYSAYFLAHLGFAAAFDAQLVLDRSLFPKQLVDALDQYVKEYKDPFIANPPHWFKSLLYVELGLQVPFLFLAFFGSLAGARWMRTPTLMYCTSVIVMVLPLISHIMQGTFTGSEVGPKTEDERVKLAGLYAAFLVAGVVILLDYTLLRCPRTTPPTQARLPTTKEKEGKDKKRN